MSSADKIKKLFEKAELGVNPDADEKVFQDVFEARQKIKTKAPAMPGIWRITMKSPITKLAIAAVITIACVTGVLMLHGTSGIALANVLNRIEQISSYMYEISINTTEQITPDKSVEECYQISVLTSQEYGSRILMNRMLINIKKPDQNDEGGNLEEKYILPSRKKIITIKHKQKQYKVSEINDTTMKQMQKEDNNPYSMIEEILKYDYKSLGISIVNGIKTEVFQTSDLNYQGGAFDRVDIRLWVDVKTSLPVLIEKDLQKANLHIIVIANNFEWNVPVNEADFEPVIPDDYTTGQPMLQMLPPAK